MREAPVEERRLKVGEINIHYRVAGQGPAVLLLHGGGNNGKEWKANLPPLAQRFRV